MSGLTRRQWVAATAAGAVGLATRSLPATDGFPPVRAVTRGPKFHWFGYYDKFAFSADNRYLLSNQVDFEHRSPTADDVIRVGMIDLQDGDKWTELGECRAWGWQQGCMLQWRPGQASEVLWNDRVDGQFVCHVLDVKSGKKRTLPKPIYTVSPDGSWGLSVDFSRIEWLRPGYGYAGVPDKVRDVRTPSEIGIDRVDLNSGKSVRLVSISDAAKVPHLGDDVTKYWHWFNHLLINQTGERFIFLNRWRKITQPTTEAVAKEKFHTRMFTANADGTDLYVLDPSGNTSHFIWRDPDTICAWTQPVAKKAAFYLLRDRTQEIHSVGEEKMTVNGHNTYLPIRGTEWILNDTYPDKGRIQTPYLYNVGSGQRIDIGKFLSPKEYTGEWRCDLHPRASRDGRLVAIDSTHEGQGRQQYVIDIGAIVG
jgi:hypothetical protein